MKYMRRFGDNVAFLLRDKDEAAFTSALGFSARDVAFLKEGRLILSPMDISAVSDFFHVSRESLFELHPERSQIHVLGECSENAKDKILDIMDMYCDLAEVVS